MSDLVAIAYPDKATAQAVRDKLVKLQKGHTIELGDAVIVSRDDDRKVKLHQPSLAGTGAAGGALWGSLIGLLFFAPLLGAIVGGATGAAAGALTDRHGHRRQLPARARRKARSGRRGGDPPSHKVTPDKVLPEISEYGGHVLQTSLRTEGERRLEDALRGASQSA
jgi:uncharacterized membrane protein